MKYFLLIAAFLVFSDLMGQGNERFTEEEEQKVTAPKSESSEPAMKPALSQQTQGRLIDKFRFGGYFGASFGDVTFVNLSPRVYYLATPKLWTGAGFTFIYSNISYNPPPFDESFVYGANIFALYHLIETPMGAIFVQGEYEPLSYELAVLNPNTWEYELDRVWAHGLFLGGGLSQQVGRGAVFITFLYNVTWKDADRSYYGSPYVFRIGFGF